MTTNEQDTLDYNELFNANIHLEKNKTDFNNPINDIFGKDEISFDNSFQIEDEEDDFVDTNQNADANNEDSNFDQNNQNLFNENDDNNADTNDDLDFNIETFNKKFGKNFKTEEEVKKFFEEKSNNESAPEKNLDENLFEINNIVSILQETINLSDENLMREQLKNEFKKAGKDITDEDVQIEIEDELSAYEEKDVLDTKAEMIRMKLQQVLTIKLQEQNNLLNKKKQIELEKENSEKQQIQSALLEYLNNDSFYGVKLSKEVISETYKEIRSNKFLESIKNNPKELAELALFKRFKEQIFKKASGKTYADGMQAVLDEFKVREKDNPVVRAQRKGSSGASDNSKDLIESILFEKTKEKQK